MGLLPGRSDPFYHFIAPPPDETPAQKTARLKRESDAQRQNDLIEEQIKQHKAELKKEKEVVRVLLLGQAESGKSTTLKNFRIKYAKDEWERERDSWRAVIHLNIVKSITTILQVVEEEIMAEGIEDEIIVESRSDEGQQMALGFTDQHKLLMDRLSSLKETEVQMKRRLGFEMEDSIPETFPTSEPEFDEELARLEPRRPLMKEVFVRSWNILIPKRISTSSASSSSTSSSASFILSVPDEITNAFVSCKDDMQELWEDPVVTEALRRRKLQLSETSGFFLNDLERIASKDYVVTDDDIVRARLPTLEIKDFKVICPRPLWDRPKFNEREWLWRIYDVAGCRTQRHAWIPYFEEVNVVTFVSPTSVFDQYLEEDPRKNRLDDSIEMWKLLCGTKLLEKSQLIVFLNKCDLLRKKLKRGVRLDKYVHDYKNRPNEGTAFVKFLNDKFKDIHKRKSPVAGRHTYIFPTNATNTADTARILESVRDKLLRDNLSASQLI